MITHVAVKIENDPSFPEGYYDRIPLDGVAENPDHAVKLLREENLSEQWEGFVIGVIYDGKLDSPCCDMNLTDFSL